MLLLLNPYVDAILCLALAFIGLIILRGIFSSLSGLPVIGGKLAGLAGSVYQAMTSALGKAFRGIDSAVGGSLHGIANLIRRAAHTIESDAAVVAHVAQVVGSLLYRVSGLHALVHEVNALAHLIRHRFHTITHALEGIGHDLRTFEHEVAKGIGHDVLPRIRSLDREMHRLTHRVIPGLRDLAGEAETDAQTALKKVEAIPFPADAKTWAEAVAVALPVLGLEWLRCSSNPFNRNPRACGMWSELAQLLGIAFIAAELASLEELIKIAQAVTEDVVKGAETLLKV